METALNPGAVTVSVGFATTGGVEGYVEISITAKYNTSYVGIVNMSKFNVDIVYKVKKPEDLR